MNDDDSIFCKGEIGVSFPAVFVPQFGHVFPEVIMCRNFDGADEFSIASIPYHNFVLIGCTEEVAIDVDGDVAGDLGQVQGAFVQVDGVEDAAFPRDVISVDPSARFKVSHHKNHFT